MRTLRLIALMLAVSPGCRVPGLLSRHDPLDDPSASMADAADHSSTNGEQTASGPQTGPGDVEQANSVADAMGLMQPSAYADAGGFNQPVTPQSIQALPVSELLARGERAVNEQRLRDARLHLEMIVQKQPSHPRAHHLLAIVSDREGRFGDAEHHYQAALQAEPNNAAVIGDLGYSYLLQRRYDLAEQYLHQARAVDPSHVNAAQNLALLASRRGDYNGARETLSEILPPADVERKLAQLFPAGPAPQAWQPPQMPGNSIPPQYATTAPGGWPSVDPRYAQQVPPPGDAAINDQLAAIDRAGFAPNGAPIVVGPPPVGAPAAAGVTNAWPGTPQTMQTNGNVATPGQVQSAVGFQPEVGDFTGADAAPESPAVTPPTRRWPPTTWPPSTRDTGIEPASAEFESESPPQPVEPRGGVMYLMPNRPRSVQSVPPAMPPVQPPAPRTSESLTEPVLYNTGPGNSRTVIWNGPLQTSSATDSVVVPAPASDDAARRTAAAMGLNAGSNQPYPLVERTSPGTSSLVGTQYPAPERQLPGMSTPATLSAGPGVNAPSPPMAGTPEAAALPYLHFDAATAPPAADMQRYTEERARFDQQFNAQVAQSYGQSPSNFIPSPSGATPAPVHELPAYRPQAGSTAPPLNPETGTPWPGRPAQAASTGVAGSGQTPTARPGQAPNSNGIIVPPPYTATQRVTAPAAPTEAYPYRADEAYQGPVIRPGSW
jgi:Flp pilus assembly protein TadD